MSHCPALNTPLVVSTTYSSPRNFQQSYKVLPPALVFSRESHSSYRRNGDSSSRDNWILGKGANVHDGWDGWSVVQGEKRYWDSKLSKPEFRGKCGGAAANRLSEEKIVRKLTKNALHDVEVPTGTRKTDVLYDRRSDQIAAISDGLFREYFPELAPVSVASPKRAITVPASPSTPRSKQSKAPIRIRGDEEQPSASAASPSASTASLSSPYPLVNYSSKVVKLAASESDAIPTPPQRVGGQYDRSKSAAKSTATSGALASASCCGRGSLGATGATVADKLAPAGMPTNGAHHQHLPQVPLSPRAEKRR